MVQTFQQTNAKWENTKVVMSDKDLKERTVFKKEFPNATLHICLFHVLKSFRRKVITNKLSILPSERHHVFSKLACSKSELEYDEHYQALLKL